MTMVNGQSSMVNCNGDLAPREHTISAGDIRWRYLTWGAGGAPLVLWHGITNSARDWWRVGPWFAARGWHVFAPDMPGHGATDDAPAGYAIPNTARLLDAWLHALALDQPIILGHSWGGVNALVHAAAPETRVRPRLLVLEDPALLFAADPGNILPAFTAGVGLPANDQTRAAIAAANPRWHPCDVWWKAESRQQVRLGAVHSFFYDNLSANFLDRMGALPMPTLMLLGDQQHGGIWQAPWIDLARRTAPQATIDVIAGSGHNIHRDSFDAFAATVAKFLQQHTL